MKEKDCEMLMPTRAPRSPRRYCRDRPKGEDSPLFQADMHFNAAPDIFKKAEILRNDPTETERILWEKLRKNALGEKFRRQHPLGYYIADFYCHRMKIAIEVDGEYHSSIDQKQRDQYRDEFFKENGIRVLRFTDEEIINNLPEVLDRIKSNFLV